MMSARRTGSSVGCARMPRGDVRFETCFSHPRLTWTLQTQDGCAIARCCPVSGPSDSRHRRWRDPAEGGGRCSLRQVNTELSPKFCCRCYTLKSLVFNQFNCAWHRWHQRLGIPRMRKARLPFLLLAIVLVVGGVLVWGAANRRSSLTPPAVEVDPLTQAACEAVGGDWDACGSACRETPEAVCIQVCVEYCECASDADCPSGYTCQRFVGETGICQSGR